MKDEHDKRTLELVPPVPAPEQAAELAALAAAPRLSGARKPRRLPGQSSHRPPQVVDSESGEVLQGKPRDPELGVHAGWLSGYVVPPSFVAKDWGISARRVRVMLAEGRLAGQLLPNGYWEVFYPYRYVIGTRGPAIKRQREMPERPKKRERNEAW